MLREGVERSHIAPVTLGGCLFPAHDMGVEVVHVNGVVLVEARNDVLAEVGGSVFGALQELAHQELARKDVVAHAGEAVAGVAGHFLRVLGLFLETDHAVVGINFDNAEFTGLGNRHRNSGDCEEGGTAQVEINHLVDVHLVDVVTSENGYEVRAFVGNQVDVLEDGVGCTLVPVVASAHLCRNQVHVLVEACVQVPGCRNVLVQGIALELRQDFDFKDSGVDKVVQNKVDNTVGSAKVHGRLCAVAGERLQSASLTACHNHA